MSSNGWPGKPGVPLNPERDGWHWVNSTPREWVVFDDGGAWRLAGSDYRPHEWAHRIYQGPCLTPAEVKARVKQARRNALEEAARWHDEQEKFWMEKGREVSALDSQSGLNLLAKAAEHRKHAAAIRALKGEGDE